MPNVVPHPVTTRDYAVLRQTGTSALRAAAELGLAPGAGRRLEKAFQSQAARAGGDTQTPRFARHSAHVAAVMAQGGFCAFSERRLAGEGVSICLPLIWPAEAGTTRRG